MQESFARNEGKRLSYIFDLNYQTIRKISIALLVVSLSYVVLFIILIIFFINANKSYRNNCSAIIAGFSGLLIYIAWIAKFVLSLLLYHFIESGDIGKYDDFLDCKNVREKYFDKFNDISKLRRCFLAFAILNIISESLDKAKDLFEGCKGEN